MSVAMLNRYGRASCKRCHDTGNINADPREIECDCGAAVLLNDEEKLAARIEYHGAALRALRFPIRRSESDSFMWRGIRRW